MVEEDETGIWMGSASPRDKYPRTPFKRRDRPETGRGTLLAGQTQRRSLQFNAVLLAASLAILCSSDLQVLLQRGLWVLSAQSLFLVASFLAVLATGNVLSVLWLIYRRATTASEGQPHGATIPSARDERARPAPTESPLPPPRNFARDGRLLLQTPQRSSPMPISPARRRGTEAMITQTPRTLPPTTAVLRTPEALAGPERSSPYTPARRWAAATSPVSPTFAAVYDSPRREETTAGDGNEAKGVPEPDGMGGSRAHRVVAPLCNPLPDTGSPIVNRVATERLPEWTEALRLKLASGRSPVPPAKAEQSPAPRAPDSQKVSAPPSLERRIVSADQTLTDFGLVRTIDTLMDNLRRWILRKIIIPLNRDILEISTAFANSGLGHLSPESPATFSLFSRPSSSGNGTIMLAAGNFAAAAKPQTLLELSQKYPQDPVVQTRLRLERYLSFASLSSQRAAVIRRLAEIVEDGLISLACKYPLGGKGPAGAEGTMEHAEDDSQMLVHLFCSFMDEHLPSESFYDPQPFSSCHFVAVDEKPSSSPNAVQIQQVSRHPSHFRLIAGQNIYDVYPGPSSIYHVIVLLVEYLHREQHGFLGVGNLGSPAVELLSILDV